MNPDRERTGSARLDQILVDRGLAPTRAKAQALILAGKVRCGDRRLDKPGTRVTADLELTVDAGPRYVGRGGHKLRGALDRFGVDLAGQVVVDVGASTGGFTQVALEAGARRVLAVDVGRGQLDWSLRTDPRVTPVEGVNARHLAPGDLPERPDAAVVDVSFISLSLVLPAVTACVAPDALAIVLVKPQFEVGREQVGKGGLVRDPSLHREVLARIADVARDLGWSVSDVAPSPITGARGNVEYFLCLRRGSGARTVEDRDRRVADAVAEAHDREAP